MAAAAVIRRMRGRTSDNYMEQETDCRPAYFRNFPDPSNVVKDIQLGVLLGRYAEN